MKPLTQILLLLLLPFYLSATHIIGGEINYRCLGNNNYEITLQLFRDCDTGVPWFEDPATINVLDANGVEIYTIYMGLRNNDTLPPFSEPCSGISANACIHTTTYRENFYLPNRPGGYHLVHTICCRNMDIVNIVDPDNTEASYHAYISEIALLTCNNGARFDGWPEFYICNGEPLQLDHSAIDVEGDSIRYELYTPYSDYPFPVTWSTPYNVNNMLGIQFPFSIHPTTGLITGTPTNNGTFIVGICAKEYRNGTLISITRRDFQFIVTTCIDVLLADFESNIPDCNHSMIVDFTNTSFPLIGGFLWNFGDGTSSTITNPSHLYQNEGIYTVMLIAGRSTSCADTIFKDISLYRSAMDITVSTDTVICNVDSILVVAHNAFDYYNNVITYTWTPTNNILSGQGTDSVWITLAGASSLIHLHASNTHGCDDSLDIPINNLPIDLVEANFGYIDIPCNTNLTIPFMNQSIANSTQFLWNFGNLATSTETNPTYTFPDTGTYIVSLVAGIGQFCKDTVFREIYVDQSSLSIMASDSQFICKGDTVLLTASILLPNYHEVIQYEWSPSTNIISGQGTDSVLVIANTDITFNVIATNTENCKDTSLAYINISSFSPALSISANPDSIFVGQSSQLYATNSFDYIYEWIPDTTLSAYDIYNPTATPRQTTTYYLNITNQHCINFDSITVFLKAPSCENPVVFVPNAFSPDGDGHNDILMVNGNNINQMNMVIYNRWGQKIFETNDQNIGWDGSFNGKALPPDIYGYYMQCTCDDGGKLFLKGNITLLK